ncbi:VIT family-domain-containing protein [Usnea florida]
MEPTAIELESQSPAPHPPTSTSPSPSRNLSPTQRTTVLQRIRNFKPSPGNIKDAVIGVSDGIVVPFAVAAGLTDYGNAKVVVSGGLAELFAGAISMGLGGLLGSKSDSLEYNCKRIETETMIRNDPAQTTFLFQEIWTPYHSPPLIAALLDEFKSLPLSEQTNYLLLHYHHLSPPSASSPFVSCIILASGYFIGGFIPLIPYLCVKRPQVFLAFFSSIAVVVVCLFAFGWVKTGSVVGWKGRKNVKMGMLGAAQMVGLGVCAAGAAVGIVKGINRGQKGV